MNDITRFSILADRHRMLGSGLEEWNGMGTAWSYATDPEKEHDAVRDAMGLFDMSPLKKVFVNGPDAQKVIDHLITRDASKIQPTQSAYTAILTEDGMVADDAIVANNGWDEWFICHGTGSTMALLQASAKGLDVSIRFDDDLHSLSLQGPKSPDFLNQHSNQDISSLGYFRHMEIRLFDKPVRLSRTGYSGEKGYEILVRSEHVVALWDALLSHGQKEGLMPCSFAALDKVRVEAGLLFYGYDMSAEHTPWEVGLGFTISKQKADFRGKAACFEAKGKERFVGRTIIIDTKEALAGGEIITQNGTEVGIVNSPVWSHRLEQSLALAHIHPNVAKDQTKLTLKDLGYHVTVVEGCVYDPTKSIVRS